MELTMQQLKADIEVAIQVRDECNTLAKKDALERIINFTEEAIKLLKK